MNGKIIITSVIILAAASVIAYKQVNKPAAENHPEVKVEKTETKKVPSIIAVVNSHEAGEVGGCGDIIALVKEAKTSGVPTQELPPDTKSELIKEYQIVVNPTVLILDSQGKVKERFEGESPETIEKIRTNINQMIGKK